MEWLALVFLGHCFMSDKAFWVTIFASVHKNELIWDAYSANLSAFWMWNVLLCQAGFKLVRRTVWGDWKKWAQENTVMWFHTVPVQVGHHVLHCDVVTQRQSSDELSEFEHSTRHNPSTLGSMVLFTKPLNLLTHIDEVVVDVKGE